MIDAIVGCVNNEIVLSFDLEVGDDNDPKIGDVSNLDPKNRKCILKDSKAMEKGNYISFSESENSKNPEYKVVYKDMTNNISVLLKPSKVAPKTRIYIKLPTPERYELSELHVTGNFEIQKINIENSKKTLRGSDFQEKLVKEKKLSIDHKLFFDVVGPPLVEERVVESEIGEIKMVRNKISVDI
jgi:hypothetical protein